MRRRSILARGLISLLVIAAAVELCVVGAPGARAQTPPTPPITSLTWTRTATATTLLASWVPAQSADPGTYYLILLSDETGVRQGVWCIDPCTSMPAPGLEPGHSYRVQMAPLGPRGFGPTATSPWLWVDKGCAAVIGMCATVGTNTDSGPAELRAQGFLHGMSRVWQPGGLASVQALRPQFWRVRIPTGSPPGAYADFDTARALGAQTIVLIPDAWHGATYDPARGGSLAPWTDWARYRTWVRSYVQGILQTGRRPTYWEPLNEPGVPVYMNATDAAAQTPERALEQFRIAYQEIKALDPTANVVGPSLDAYSVQPGLYGKGKLELRAFLDYVVARGIRPAAIVWHEVHVKWALGNLTGLPVSIEHNIDEIRTLLARRGMSDVKVLINEYAAPETYASPGWSVGSITSLEAANVDGAGRSCHESAATAGGMYSSCNRGLDGLYAEDDQTTLGNYWVHRAYADMTGTRLDTNVSTARMSVFATRDASGTVRALVGRHEECSPRVARPPCGTNLPMPPSMVVGLDFLMPQLVAPTRVVVTRVPADGGPLAAPVPVLNQVLTPVLGKLSLLLPAVEDGDAYIVTATPL